MDIYTKIRNGIGIFLYKILRKILFLVDAEKIHDKFIRIGELLGKYKISQQVTSIFFNYKANSLNQKVLGIDFENPIGLAAGFDKDAKLINIIKDVGFGYQIVGSITAKPYEGNPKPRILRLKKSKALIVNYGLKSLGALKIFEDIKNKNFKSPVGISIAYSNYKENSNISNAINDYIFTYKLFKDIGDFYELNISCPNVSHTKKLFLIPKNLDMLLYRLSKLQKYKPIFLKISPDLEFNELDNIIKVINNYKLIDGLVLSNVTINRNNPDIFEKEIFDKGGISGKPLQKIVNEKLKYLYKKTNGKYVIVSCGGIFDGKDAYERIKNGATLLQIITSMIYEGPFVISNINQEIAEYLKKEGYNNIKEAIGKNFKN